MNGLQPTLVVFLVAPGAICAVMGFGLSLLEAHRSGRKSRLGIRLNLVGLGLLFLVPGAGVIALVITGDLLWPAALGGLAAVALGLANLSLLRFN